MPNNPATLLIASHRDFLIIVEKPLKEHLQNQRTLLDLYYHQHLQLESLLVIFLQTCASTREWKFWEFETLNRSFDCQTVTFGGTLIIFKKGYNNCLCYIHSTCRDNANPICLSTPRTQTFKPLWVLLWPSLYFFYNTIFSGSSICSLVCHMRRFHLYNSQTLQILTICIQGLTNGFTGG